MSPGRPDRVAINPDEGRAEHVGRLADGRQFFLTTPMLCPLDGVEVVRQFLALYLFEASGKFLEARIDDFGPRETMDEKAWRVLYMKRLRELGRVKFTRIVVEPFAVERFGATFGLIARDLGEDGDEGLEGWTVEVMPGNYMAFFAPWDSGEYDT